MIRRLSWHGGGGEWAAFITLADDVGADEDEAGLVAGEVFHPCGRLKSVARVPGMSPREHDARSHRGIELLEAARTTNLAVAHAEVREGVGAGGEDGGFSPAPTERRFSRADGCSISQLPGGGGDDAVGADEGGDFEVDTKTLYCKGGRFWRMLPRPDVGIGGDCAGDHGDCRRVMECCLRGCAWLTMVGEERTFTLLFTRLVLGGRGRCINFPGGRRKMMGRRLASRLCGREK